jgi:hypothetical protein
MKPKAKARKKPRLIRATIEIFEKTVERDAEGIPTAFRIWFRGDNQTDYCHTVFSDRSAQLLMAEQKRRGNLYSIDVDHMSVEKDAPIANHRAVGFHRLDVRNGDLWATNVEWCDDIRATMQGKVPAWRYFSPCYCIDEDTSEVISYTNTALTNNPATWFANQLATREGQMDPITVLQNLLGTLEIPEDVKAKIDEVIAALVGSKPAEEPAVEPEAAAEDPEAKPEGEPEKAAEDPKEEDPEKKEMANRISALEKLAIDAHLASRPDFDEKTVALVRGLSLDNVIKACRDLPRTVKATSKVAIDTVVKVDQPASATPQPSKSQEEMAVRIGLTKANVAPHANGGSYVVPTMTPAQAREFLAKKGK